MCRTKIKLRFKLKIWKERDKLYFDLREIKLIVYLMVTEI